MKFISHIIFSFFSNSAALLAAGYFVKGFEISPGLPNFFIVASIFTLMNIFIRPILKLILSPIIILTFGLGIFLVNVLTLYLLDFFSANITITGLNSLLYSTLIITLINILINFSAKGTYKT